VTVDATIGAGSVFAHLAGGSPDTVGLAAGANTYVIRAGDTSVNLMAGGGGFTGTIDNVTVTELAMTDITSSINSSTWTRVSITNETITNPCVAIKLATSGDAIDVDYCQSEAGAFITSPIYTGSASVTRAVDNISLAASAFPAALVTGTGFADFDQSSHAYGQYIVAHSAGSVVIFDSDTYYGSYDGTSEVSLAAVAPNNNRNKAAVSYTGSERLGAVNGTASASLAFDGNFAGAAWYFGGNAGASSLNGYLRRVMVIPRAMSTGELQTVTT
jgi:hypothetical protein